MQLRQTRPAEAPTQQVKGVSLVLLKFFGITGNEGRCSCHAQRLSMRKRRFDQLKIETFPAYLLHSPRSSLYTEIQPNTTSLSHPVQQLRVYAVNARRDSPSIRTTFNCVAKLENLATVDGEQVVARC